MFIKALTSAAVAIVLLFSSLTILAQTPRGVRVPPQTALPEARTALVIGNGNYSSAPLKNPPNDAGDMAQSLKSLGFEVLSYTDLSQNQMKKAIREFGAKLRAKGGIGLFYYAGHGIQSNGINYLIPVGAQVETEEEVEYESVEVGLILAQMESANNVMNIVILDACRNNPFARSYRSAEKGLASINAKQDMVIAYATAPGSVASDGAGRNGLYTQEILKAIQTDGLSIEDMFKRVRLAVRKATDNKQNPWESVSVTGDFYFKGTSGGLRSGNESAASNNINSAETNFWNAIKDSRDIDDFKEYLEQYPQGQFAGIARRRIQNQSDRNQTSNQPAAQREPSPLPRPMTRESNFFLFELQQCRKSGTSVVCDLTVTNKDNDRELYIAGFADPLLYDEYSAKTKAKAVRLANSELNFLTGVAAATLINGTKTSLKITFEGVSENAAQASSISIPCGVDGTHFTINFSNVPLLR